MTNGYTIPMDRLFASPLSASETLDDLALQAGQNRITQADLARQRKCLLVQELLKIKE